MMNIFVAKGSGYADDKTQDGYTVLREPLPKYEQRVFGREGHRCCYGSHSLKLATDGEHLRAGLYILVRHGGGSETMLIKAPYDAGEFREMLLGLSDELLYRMLWALYSTASEAERMAASVTADKYAKAFVEGRLKKTRVKQGRRRVYIETPQLVLQ